MWRLFRIYAECKAEKRGKYGDVSLREVFLNIGPDKAVYSFFLTFVRFIFKSVDMKTLWKRMVLLLSCILAVSMVKAQDRSYACLGTLCYVSVYLNKDSVADGYFTYTIPVPPEGIYSFHEVQGPGSPYLTNHLGNTVDLELRRSHLLLAVDGEDCEVPLELLVNKWSYDWGSYTTTPDLNAAQCYYLIRLLVTQER